MIEHATSFTPQDFLTAEGFADGAGARAAAVAGTTLHAWSHATTLPSAWWTAWRVPYQGGCACCGMRVDGLLLLVGTLN